MKRGEIIRNRRLKNDYFEVKFYVPEIAAKARAGQFVHVRIDERGDRILRRPFSIHNTDSDGSLSVVYKVVGHGTEALSRLTPGAVCDVMGPQGRGFSDPAPDVVPVFIDGGYGSAATFLMTKQAAQKGILLLGARSEADLILYDRYEAAGYEVKIATNDGSVGKKGFVTELIADLLRDNPGKKFFFYGCGPHPMLMAAAKLLTAANQPGELSIDHVMCCGVGACFACVVKVKADTPEHWRYARSCSEGPVFPLEMVYTED